MSQPHTNPETATPDGSGRDADGRFAKGNAGGPGNPYARQVAALRQLLLERLTPEKFAAVADALIQKATEGNVQAAKLLFSYALGKPAPAPDPDRLAVDEWQRYKEQATMLPELTGLLAQPDAELPLSIIRVTKPGVTKQHQKTLLDVLKNPEKYEPEIPDLEMVDEQGNPLPNGVSDPGAVVGAPSPNGVFDPHCDAAALRVGGHGLNAPSANGKKRPHARA